MNPASLIALSLQLLPLVKTGLTEFVAWINSLRAAAIANGEWTPEQQEAYRTALLDADIQPWEQPDAE